MRTKYFLTALALPAVFAACTSDELDTLNSKEEMKNRIELQNVSFGTNGVSTRLAQGDNFNQLLFESNDGMGACLIDAPNATWGTEEADHIKWYNLNTDRIQTNYRYNYAEGTWTSQANLVEGNYMFYMPYGIGQSRGAILANLPTTQALAKDVNGEYSTFGDVIAQSVKSGAPLVAGYKFLKEGDSNTKLDLTLQHLYAYPKITLTNVLGKDVEISQIVLTMGDGQTFTVKAPFKYASAANQTAYTEADQNGNSFVDCFFDAATATEGKNGQWSEGEISNTEAKTTASLLGSASEGGTSEQITIKVPDNKMTIKKDEAFSFYAVIPAADYKTNQLKVSLYTTDGKSSETTLGKCVINPGKRYPVEEYNADGVIETKGQLLSGAIQSLTDKGGVAVSSNEALLAAIRDFEPTAEKKELEIRVVGENVSINNLIANMLRDKRTGISSSEIKFLNDVVIDAAGNLEATTNFTVVFQGNVTMKGANTIGENITFTSGKTITVAADANVTLGGTTTGVLVNNNGTLNVPAALELGSVKNAGTLNLKQALTATVENTGTITATTANASIVGDVTNKSIFNVEKGATYAQGTGTFTNVKDATLNNSGTITTIAASQIIINHGTIENNANATLTANQSGSINNNIVNNSGKLTFHKNEGNIYVKTFSTATTVTAIGNKAGNIYNDAEGTVIFANANQNVWKTLTGNQVWPADAPANYNAVIYKNATVTVTAAESIGGESKLAAVKFIGGNLTVTGASAKVLSLPKAIDIEGTVTFTGVKDGANAAAIECKESTMTIAKGATLNLKGGEALTVAGDATNGLTINNYGNVETNVAVSEVVNSSIGVWANGGTTVNATNWTGTTATPKS